MQRLYFVPLAFLASVASANTDAESCDASDESTLLQITQTAALKTLAVQAANLSEASVAVNISEQQHQFDIMYNAVAALVTKQAQSSGSNVTDGQQPSPGSSHANMLQQGANPFGALNDALQGAKDKANEAVGQAKEKAKDLADNLNVSSITDSLGDMVSGKGADMLKKFGDMKDQFTEKLNSTLGQAMDQFGDLKDKLEDAKDEQVLQVAKSLAKAGDMTEGMAQSALEKVQDKITELEGLREELDKIFTDEELAAAKEKLVDKLDDLSGLLSLLNSVAHTDIDLDDVKAGEDKIKAGEDKILEDVRAKVEAAKAQLQKALDKAKSAEQAGQAIVDTLKNTLAKIDNGIAKLEAKAAANDEGEDESKQDDTNKAASKGDAEKDPAVSIVKSLFSEMNTVREVIQGTYKPVDGEQEGAADSAQSDNGDAKSSDNGEKAVDSVSSAQSDNGDASSDNGEKGDDFAADAKVDNTKVEKSGAGAAAGIPTVFFGIAMCNAL